MARTYGPGGEMKKRKKGEPFNSKEQIKSRMASLATPRGSTHLPSDGPGTLLDRRDTDFIEDQLRQHGGTKGYPSDREFPSGTFPLAKKKKKSKKRTA